MWREMWRDLDSIQCPRSPITFPGGVTVSRLFNSWKGFAEAARERVGGEVEFIERMEQLGDSPRPQHVIRARTALFTLIADI